MTTWLELREEIAIRKARETRLRERIDDLTDRCEELREQRDLALHDLWKSRLFESYWRNFAKKLWRRKSEPEDSLLAPSAIPISTKESA